MEKHHVYLIPGFFGFANLGGITYFHHVNEFLTEALADRGIDASIHAVGTLPTASVRMRAQTLLEQIEDTAADDDAPIHLVGHSTGGLDARLFATPDVTLGDEIDSERFATRLRSITLVATPNYGTPSAAFFDTIMGQKLLYVLSLATVYSLRFGKLPLSVLLALAGVISRLDDKLGFEKNVLDQFYEELFADFDDERKTAIQDFLGHIVQDQSALGQITPGGIDLFNATVNDRDGVRYGSVVTRARKPGLKSTIDVGLNPYEQASNALYQIIYRITGRTKTDYHVPSDEQRAVLEAAYGEIPSPSRSDGMCPTLSQIWGEIVHAAKADHLDVCGHFSDDGEHDPPHVDWLASGTGFTRRGFENLWGDVATFVAG
jgi:pimeloyl-ACP methyl ester carboxylesterase